jgi:hypothetical protein
MEVRPQRRPGLYKGRLVDERAAAQRQVDKSFLKSGICAIAFQFAGFSRCGSAARRTNAFEPSTAVATSQIQPEIKE